jgi:hypothetical protein
LEAVENTMTNIDLNYCSSLSKNNAGSVGVDCGCFYCIAVIKAGSVIDFVDGGKTAICPKCGIDSLIPNQTDLAILKQCSDIAFSCTK